MNNDSTQKPPKPPGNFFQEIDPSFAVTNTVYQTGVPSNPPRVSQGLIIDDRVKAVIPYKTIE